MATVRPREDDEPQDERPSKRRKLSEDEQHQADTVPDGAKTEERAQGQFHVYNLENLLPPSRELLGLPPAPPIPPDGVMHRTSETDVGISEYIGKGLPTIHGIIKQRYVCPWILAPVLGLTLLDQLYRFLSLRSRPQPYSHTSKVHRTSCCQLGDRVCEGRTSCGYLAGTMANHLHCDA